MPHLLHCTSSHSQRKDAPCVCIKPENYEDWSNKNNVYPHFCFTATCAGAKWCTCSCCVLHMIKQNFRGHSGQSPVLTEPNEDQVNLTNCLYSVGSLAEVNLTALACTRNGGNLLPTTKRKWWRKISSAGTNCLRVTISVNLALPG